MTVALAQQLVSSLNRLKDRREDLFLQPTTLRKRKRHPGFVVISAYGTTILSRCRQTEHPR